MMTAMFRQIKGERAYLWWVWLAALLQHMVIGAQRPLFSLYLTHEGASVGSVALLTSIYGATALFFAYPAGAWCDRVGMRPVVVGGSLLLAAGTLAVPHAGTNLFWFAVIQALVGVGGTVALVALQSGVAAASSAENRDHFVTMLMFFSSAGQMLGPILGGLSYDLLGLNATFWVLGGVVAVNMMLPIPGAAGGGARNRTSQMTAAELIREPRLRVALFAGILVLSTIDTITTFFPIYGESIGLSATAIGLLLGVRAAASMAVRPLQPLVVSRFGRRGAMVWVLATSAVATCLLGVLSNFMLLLVLAAAAGLCLGLGQPISMAEIVDATPEVLRGRALGIRLAGNRLAQLFGPLVYGAVANVGTSLVFVGSGLLLALGAAVTLPQSRS